MNKMIVLLSTILVLILFSSENVQANSDLIVNNQTLEITMKLNDNRMLVNERPYKIEKPLQESNTNTTLVPLRAIATAFGVAVEWDKKTQMITLESDIHTIQLTIDSTEALVNAQKKTMTSAPRMLNNTAMVPIRFISENMGASVTFNKDTEVIVIQGTAKSNNTMQQGPVTYSWETIIEPVWVDVEAINNFYKVKNSDGKYGLYDSSGRMIFKPEFDDFFPISEVKALALRKKGNVNEFVNEKDQVVFSLNNRFVVREFYNGQAIIYREESLGAIEYSPSKAGVIDDSGIVIPAEYNYISREITQNGVQYVVVVNKGNKTLSGTLDRNGKVVAPLKELPTYNYHREALISENFQIAIKFGNNGDKYGAVTESGRIVIPFIYDSFERLDSWDYFVNGWSIARKGEKYGMIDRSGNTLIPFNYDRIDTLNGKNGITYKDIFRVESNGKYGLVDGRGNAVTPLEYTFLDSDVYEGKILAVKGNRFGYMDTSGKIVVPLNYERTDLPNNREGLLFQEELAIVTKNGKHGYVNSEGKEISSPQWDSAGTFNLGYAGVGKDGKFTHIDKSGKPIADPQWSFVTGFTKTGIALVGKEKDVRGVINQQGQLLFSTETIKDELIRVGINPDQELLLTGPDEEGYTQLRTASGDEYFISREGKIPSFSNGNSLIHGFRDGYAHVYDGPITIWDGYAKAVDWETPGGTYHILDTDGNIVMSYPKSVTTYKNDNYFFWDELGAPLDYIGIADEGGKYGVVALRLK